MATVTMSFHLADDELLQARHASNNGVHWITLVFGRSEVVTYFRSEEEAAIYVLAINSACLQVTGLRENAGFEAAKHSDPCTDEAREHGCTCTMEHSHSASIDPPEPIVDRDCPLHGNAPDPDEAYDRMRDDSGNP